MTTAPELPETAAVSEGNKEPTMIFSVEKPWVSVTNTTASELLPAVLSFVVRGQQHAPRIFTQRGGVLVRLRDQGHGEVEVLTEKSLKLELDRAVEFREASGLTYRKVKPPADVVSGILTADRFPELPQFPELRRVAQVPYFTSTGNLVMTFGYHEESRTALQLPDSLDGLTVPEVLPSFKAVAAAKRLLVEELFVDFPFAAPSSRAHALALLITPFVRDMLGTTPVPMAAIVAPTVGSGKTKIAHVVSLIVTGRTAPIMAADLSREETEKRITALLLEARPYGVFDNQIEKLDSPVLAALLTSDTWSGRLLGQSKMLTLWNTTQWIVTGNNLEFTDEIARRALTIKLDPKTDKPNLRTGFKHDPLETWVKAERPALVSAILVLVQNWLAKGRKEFTARTLGSFESYARIVGGVLQAAGLDEGFLTETETEHNFSIPAPDADVDLVRFVKAWELGLGWQTVTTSQLLDYAHDALFPSGCKDKVVALGRFIQKNEGRTINGLRIQPEKVKGEGSRLRNAWRLVDVATEAEAWE